MAIGGYRPGSGRKKKPTVEAQQTRRDVVISVLTPTKLREIVTLDVEAACAGDTARIDRWLAYALGSPKQEIEHSGKAEIVLTYVNDWREHAEDGVS